MNENVDLGAVQIHKKVIGDIAAAAIKGIRGVDLARFGLIGSIFDVIGLKNYPGVSVAVDNDGQVSLEIRIIVEYGLNISMTASQVQDTVRAAVAQAVDIDLKAINVNIQAVERRAA